jgi:hypothetical protein
MVIEFYLGGIDVGICRNKGRSSSSYALSCEIPRTEGQVISDACTNLRIRVNAVLPGLLLSECTISCGTELTRRGDEIWR